MITLNGKKFAETEKEFTESLFTNQTCSGYARRNMQSVTIMDMQKNKIGVINSHGVLCAATKLDNGRYWYSHADIPEIGRYESYMQQVTECRELVGK